MRNRRGDSRTMTEDQLREFLGDHMRNRLGDALLQGQDWYVQEVFTAFFPEGSITRNGNEWIINTGKSQVSA